MSRRDILPLHPEDNNQNDDPPPHMIDVPLLYGGRNGQGGMEEVVGDGEREAITRGVVVLMHLLLGIWPALFFCTKGG